MKVAIYSREKIEQYLQGNIPDNIAVISFYDPPAGAPGREDTVPVDYSGKINRVFQVAIEDIYYDELDDICMSYEEFFPEADALAEFILQAEKEGFDIICQCDYGQSRSAGCAAAILEFFYHKGISVFADYKYCPNQMVYHKVYDALQRCLGRKKNTDLEEKKCFG